MENTERDRGVFEQIFTSLCLSAKKTEIQSESPPIKTYMGKK